LTKEKKKAYRMQHNKLISKLVKDTNHQIFLRSDLQIFVSAMYHIFLNSKTLE